MDYLPTSGEIAAMVATQNALNWSGGMDRRYILSHPENGLVLVHCNSNGERLVWIEISDNVGGFHWGGYLCSNGNIADTVEEIMQMDGLI
jgi:hypothetical protein